MLLGQRKTNNSAELGAISTVARPCTATMCSLYHQLSASQAYNVEVSRSESIRSSICRHILIMKAFIMRRVSG